VLDAAGNIYVGNVGGGIRRFDSAGALLSTSLATTRIDFMDLSADQSTMLYTQEGNRILRVNVATNTGLSDFSTAVDSAFALRIRGNGQVLVADGDDIELLNANGTDNRTYDIAGAGTWFALNLDADGTSFWSATTNGLIAHFDIATDAVLGNWTVSGTNGTWGLALKGEFTQGGGGGGGTVPEPASLLLFGICLAALGFTRLRKRA
jgi:PEP-CTERM motif